MKTVVSLTFSLLFFSAYAQNDASTDSVKAIQLDEIVVTGKKPQIKGHDGIITIDLPNIVKDKPVTNVLEALSYLPGVTDNNGLIWLSGASDVTILLNGELTNMPANNLYQLLYSIPIDRLSNVEVMYTAPAKYHVNGAAINIILRTPTPLDGLQGQIRAGYNQGHYASYGAGVAATYAARNWSFDFNYSISQSNTWNREETFSNHLLNGTRTVVNDEERRKSQNLANLIYASTAYQFSERSRISLTYNGQILSNITHQSFSYGTLGNYVNNATYNSPTGYHNIAFRYIPGISGITIGGDYTNYKESRSQHLISFAEKQELVTAVNEQDINRYHAYIDQAHDISTWQLSYGIEYQHADDRSRQTYELPAQSGFDGTLKEDVADAYIGIQHNFLWGLSFNASAKGEYYHNNYQHNWNFIPQLGASYYKTPTSIFQLNLTTQRTFPSYWELHSGTSYLNNYSVIIGNPELQPYLNYSGQLSYIFKQKYIATFYLQYDDKATVQLPYQSPDELKLIYQTINMNFKRVAGINLHIPLAIKSFLSSTISANVFNQHEKADRFHAISFDNQKWVFYGILNNTIKLAPHCPVSLSVDLQYISPSLQGIANLSSIRRIDAGIKWLLGKKQCCELNLKCDDIFNTWSPSLTINQAGQDYRMKVHNMTQNFKLTFIWRFNDFKSNDNTIDTSRFGTGK